MLVYCGIPTTQQSFLGVARSLESPILVSANAFWKNDRFCNYEVLWDIEVPLALDSGGFVAMRKYGGYRWKVLDYLELTVMLRPVWCPPNLDGFGLRWRFCSTLTGLAPSKPNG